MRFLDWVMGLESRMTRRLMARRRAILLDTECVEFAEVVRHRDGWRLRRHRREALGRLEAIEAEEGLLRKGATLIQCDQPLLLTPPPGEGESEEDWLQKGPRELLGVTTCASVLEPRFAPRVSGWWREGELERSGQEFAWCDAAMPGAFLVVAAIDALCAPPVWFALRVVEHSAYLWLMKGEKAHHGCRLSGGGQDLPLLRREIGAAMNACTGERQEWAGAGIALVAPHARVEEILEEAGLGLVDFPWKGWLQRIPHGARWGSAAAALERSECPWENWRGPALREEHAVRLGFRTGLFSGVAILFLAAIQISVTIWNGRLEMECGIRDSKLASSRKWMSSLDSLERSGATMDRSASVGLAGIANCSSPGLRFLSWKAGDAPKRHSLELYAGNEAAWLAMKACLENTGLFEGVVTRSLELRKDGRPGERARVFAEAKER